MNGGNVYHTLLYKVNDNLVKIIQSYNIIEIDKGKYLDKLLSATNWLRFYIDNPNWIHNSNQIKKIRNEHGIWIVTHF